MTIVRCKKEYGEWQYNKIPPDPYGELDGPIYELYNSEGQYVTSFGRYRDMIYYIETGVIV